MARIPLWRLATSLLLLFQVVVALPLQPLPGRQGALRLPRSRRPLQRQQQLLLLLRAAVALPPPLWLPVPTRVRAACRRVAAGYITFFTAFFPQALTLLVARVLRRQQHRWILRPPRFYTMCLALISSVLRAVMFRAVTPGPPAKLSSSRALLRTEDGEY